MSQACAWIVWAHLGSTLFMTGLIWYVQLVHYPLMASVGREAFWSYHRQHTTRTGWVVVPPMLLEAATAALLLWPGCAGVGRPVAATGLALVALIWISTFALQVPCHQRLAGGFDARVHLRLVRTNWLRTAAWSARGALAVMVAASAG
jgi:hypothetical protein